MNYLSDLKVKIPININTLAVTIQYVPGVTENGPNSVKKFIIGILKNIITTCVKKAVKQNLCIRLRFLKNFISEFKKFKVNAEIFFKVNFHFLWVNQPPIRGAGSSPHMGYHFPRENTFETPCLLHDFNVKYNANERVTGMKPISVKRMGFFITYKLREVRCLRSPLPVTCNSLAFSHFLV